MYPTCPTILLKIKTRISNKNLQGKPKGTRRYNPQARASRQTSCIPNIHPWLSGRICPSLFYSFLKPINRYSLNKCHCRVSLNTNSRLLGNGCRCPSNGGYANYTQALPSHSHSHSQLEKHSESTDLRQAGHFPTYRDLHLQDSLI